MSIGDSGEMRRCIDTDMDTDLHLFFLWGLWFGMSAMASESAGKFAFLFWFLDEFVEDLC